MSEPSCTSSKDTIALSYVCLPHYIRESSLQASTAVRALQSLAESGLIDSVISVAVALEAVTCLDPPPTQDYRDNIDRTFTSNAQRVLTAK